MEQNQFQLKNAFPSSDTTSPTSAQTGFSTKLSAGRAQAFFVVASTQ
jgi:hypothetical protein